MRNITFITAAGLALTGAMATAQAATVTECGVTVCYEYDDSQPGIAKFGLPTLIGDTMRFTPNDWKAESANGGADIDSATFVFDRVWSISGADLIDISAAESGDYRIQNGGSVDADLFIQTASNLNAFDVATETDSFGASGDSGGIQQWSMNAMINPLAEFGAGASNDFSVTLQNTLAAITSESGDLAWIQKKLVLGVAVIPIPAAVWLFGSALGLLVWVRRRAAIA